jgi:hypothetical protein
VVALQRPVPQLRELQLLEALQLVRQGQVLRLLFQSQQDVLRLEQWNQLEHQ